VAVVLISGEKALCVPRYKFYCQGSHTEQNVSFKIMGSMKAWTQDITRESLGHARGKEIIFRYLIGFVVRN
jgi:hypothetical protein